MRKFLAFFLLLALAALPLAVFAQETPTPIPGADEPTPIAEPTEIPEPTRIEIGDTVEGELTEESPNSFYIFSASEGDVVSITHVSEDFDSYLVLTDSDGNVIAVDDDGAGNLDSRIDYTVEEDGDYIIIVESYSHYNGSGFSEGAYILTLSTIEQEVIEYGETVDGELTAAALEQLYVFTGSAGDVVSITLMSDAFDSYLFLDDPDGYELSYNDDGAGNLNSRIGPLTLPYTGTYTIRATSFSRSATGPFTLSLDRVQMEQIEVGDTVTVEFTPDMTQYYFSFEGNTGEAINVTVIGDLDTNLTINDPYNYYLISDEDGGPGKNPEILDYVLNTSGTFTMILGNPFGGEGPVEVTFTLSEIPSLDDGPVTLNFTSSAYTRSVNYTAEAGQTLRLIVQSTGGQISPSVDIYDSDSYSIAYASSSYISELSFVFTVATDGELQINISDYSYNNTSVIVSIEEVEE